jgi:curli biogenesis system outer membrane secretion channel CsgG
MKKSILNPVYNLLMLTLVTTPALNLSAQQDVDIENIREKCTNVPYEDRVRITVVRFNVTTPKAPSGEFGGELATMLSSALQQINCFRVLESAINMDDLTLETELSQTGYTQSGSSPEAGKMLGAQAIVTGEVTEFSESNGKAGLAGITLGTNKARVGFVLKVVIPETREIIWAKSIEAESRKPGAFSGLRIFGIEFAGSSKYNKAVADAMERAIIKGMYHLADERETIPFPTPDNSFAEKKEWSADNCPVLGSGSAPSMMVIIGEKHINQWLSSPVGETELVNKLVRAGVPVIDPAMYAAVRKGARFSEALKDPMAAVSLGSEFGADIVIVGEGISQNAGNTSGGVSCRASLDLKAIRVDNGQIVMTHSSTAGAVDIAETAAYQNALKKAGGQAADDFLEQICTRDNIAINGASSGDLSIKGGAPLSTTILNLSNTDFSNLKKITDLLKAESKIQSVERTAFSGGKATLELKHEGNLDDILDIIAGKGAGFAEITGFGDGSIQIAVRK